jgi:hypothetical protein
LYNAAPFIQNLPDEEHFHTLVQQLFAFDYHELKNSTMECMGTIGTINNTAVVTLFKEATFEARPYESVGPPNEPDDNGRWAHSISPGRSWDIYRVETVGGATPICDKRNSDVIEVEYAAEYWFYHARGEDLETIDDHYSLVGAANAMI